ncbi:hypothetical protein PVAND_016168 [Polypedilum vanderplanki]|uniref:Uncharacterized protein n=1 Tax=Polypedilum vanderplanki TaxID=319348 RepID=A0A9J6BEB8_POLVA|nr:hypothetical protein PVAND_016168 [Polypedilum vanderplanki]
MNNSNVQAFAAVNKTIHYIPHGINKIFQNINAIITRSQQLKEILFKFNNDLKILKLKKNKIKEIYPTVFDNLYQLEWLGLKENECVNDVKNNRAGVLELINIVKEQCMPDFISEINKLDNIIDNQNEAVKSLKNENEQKSSVISALETKIGNLSKSQK